MSDIKREQFSNIYKENIDKIYRFVYLKVNSQEIAEDLTSKVFLKAWESFNDSSDRIDNPGAFLYQVARNTVIDHYRAKSKEKMVPLESIAEFADDKKGIHEMAVFSADIEFIKKSMQKLKKDYQDVIMWHYLDDMTIKDIAKLVDKSEGTVRVMLHRGLKDLKNIVQES